MFSPIVIGDVTYFDPLQQPFHLITAIFFRFFWAARYGLTIANISSLQRYGLTIAVSAQIWANLEWPISDRLLTSLAGLKKQRMKSMFRNMWGENSVNNPLIGNHLANYFPSTGHFLCAFFPTSQPPLRRHQSHDDDDDVEPNDGHDDGGFRRRRMEWWSSQFAGLPTMNDI